MADEVSEIPNCIKRLARLVCKAFFQPEDLFIVDMLIPRVCMSTRELVARLKIGSRLIRTRINTLKSHKFVESRSRMEMNSKGKLQKAIYYFINYRNLVNVVKYKFDHIRKKLETAERSAINRAAFKCTGCPKTFVDFDAIQLFDAESQQFWCTFCGKAVVEDDFIVPDKNSRSQLATYNDQVEEIWKLLREIDHIKVNPELLEPPQLPKIDTADKAVGGVKVECGIHTSCGISIDVTIGGEDSKPQQQQSKEVPIWMTKSTVEADESSDDIEIMLQDAPGPSSSSMFTKPPVVATKTCKINNGPGRDSREQMMELLIKYETEGGTLHKPIIPRAKSEQASPDADLVSVQLMEVDDGVDNNEDQDPMVHVGTQILPIVDINEAIIGQMTNSEKEEYILKFQAFYGHIYDF